MSIFFNLRLHNTYSGTYWRRRSEKATCQSVTSPIVCLSKIPVHTRSGLVNSIWNVRRNGWLHHYFFYHIRCLWGYRSLVSLCAPCLERLLADFTRARVHLNDTLHERMSGTSFAAFLCWFTRHLVHAIINRRVKQSASCIFDFKVAVNHLK